MPVKVVATPTPWTTAPVPAIAPETVRTLVGLSTSLSATLPPLLPWMTPLSALMLRVASSATAPVSALAMGASLTGVTLKVTVLGLRSNAPALSCTLKVKLA